MRLVSVQDKRINIGKMNMKLLVKYNFRGFVCVKMLVCVGLKVARVRKCHINKMSTSQNGTVFQRQIHMAV